MPVIDPDALPRRHPDVLFREVDEEVYLCAADGATMYTLTDVGADIWRVCDGSRSVRDIAEHLLEIYEIDRETLQRDLEEFLGVLHERNLVSWG